MEIAASLLDIVRIWGYVGLLVAVVFLVYGIDRIDEDARGTYLFRILIIPGVILLWPLVLWRWFVLETGRDQWPLRHRPPRHAHTGAALVMLVMIPLIFVGSLAIRQSWPADYTPVQISTGEQSQ